MVRASGELDLATAPAMCAVLEDACAPGPVEVVVELSELTFVDAAGLAALLHGAEVARRAGGQLLLASPSRMLRRMLHLLDLAPRLPVTGDDGA